MKPQSAEEKIAKEVLGKCFKQVEMELMFPTIFSITTGEQKKIMKQNWADFKEATTSKIIEALVCARKEKGEEKMNIKEISSHYKSRLRKKVVSQLKNRCSSCNGNRASNSKTNKCFKCGLKTKKR